MSSVSLRIRGKDSLGGWNAHEGECLICGKRGLVMRYARPQLERFLREERAVYRDLDWEMLLNATIIGKAYRPNMTWGQGAGTIGITCGCYAKFHRQLAHIVERWKGNGRKKQQRKIAAARDAARRVG